MTLGLGEQLLMRDQVDVIIGNINTIQFTTRQIIQEPPCKM